MADQPHPLIQPWVREILRCPVGKHPLLDVVDHQGHPALECDRDCVGVTGRRQYPIVEGIPVLLADDAVIVAR